MLVGLFSNTEARYTQNLFLGFFMFSNHSNHFSTGCKMMQKHKNAKPKNISFEKYMMQHESTIMCVVYNGLNLNFGDK